MKKQKKQSVLTAIIIILVIALIMMVVSIVYEEKINISKQQTQNTIASVEQEKEDETVIEKEDNLVEDDTVEDDIKEEDQTEEKEEYVGEEEKETNTTDKQPIKNNDEKAIDLAQKEWGNDESVTFSVEEKKGTKYYVAVKSAATVIQWYEIDTETWEISEY